MFSYEKTRQRKQNIISAYFKGKITMEEAQKKISDIMSIHRYYMENSAVYLYSYFKFAIWNFGLEDRGYLFENIDYTEEEIRNNLRLYECFNRAFRKYRDYDF